MGNGRQKTGQDSGTTADPWTDNGLALILPADYTESCGRYEVRLLDLFFACVLIRMCIGDLEYLAECLRLPHHANHSQMCAWCGANLETYLFSDFRPTATWRGTIWASKDVWERVLSI